MQINRHRRMRGSKSRRPNRPRSYPIVCAGCGKEFLIQVPPPADKKLLCLECFKK